MFGIFSLLNAEKNNVQYSIVEQQFNKGKRRGHVEMFCHIIGCLNIQMLQFLVQELWKYINKV